MHDYEDTSKIVLFGKGKWKFPERTLLDHSSLVILVSVLAWHHKQSPADYNRQKKYSNLTW